MSVRPIKSGRAAFIAVIAAGALGALAAWPAFVHARTAAVVAAADPTLQMTPAPVMSDYLIRDANVAFLEGRVRTVRDPLNTQMLASEYLQRYREHMDVGDVLRSEAVARESLAIRPRANLAGDFALASALVTLHRFREARSYVGDAENYEPSDPGIAMFEASIDLELGDYARAGRIIARIEAAHQQNDLNNAATVARYDEQTGQLGEAQTLLARAMRISDANYEMPAERRAWYHFRLGEMLYESGDNAGAIAAEQAALTIFPRDPLALNALARIELANGDVAAAEDAAAQGVAVVPNPETLGILADAQTARGETAAAAATLAEFDAVEKIGNTQRINDRLIAVYLADHGRRPADAYAIAQRELAVRDDIYTEDTLAWCAAADGKWAVARTAMRKAIRFDTDDPRLQYHAGVIAAQAGDMAEARRRLRRALDLNPHFSAVFAADAQRRLASSARSE
jgi:tetratricopeptide (TPR) repeat protein